jgi:hypothetical protein
MLQYRYFPPLVALFSLDVSMDLFLAFSEPLLNSLNTRVMNVPGTQSAFIFSTPNFQILHLLIALE